MKRMIILIAMIFMLLPMNVIYVFAQEPLAVIDNGKTPIFTIEDAYGSPGDTLLVNVLLEDNPGLISIPILLSFDSNLIYKSASLGSVFPEKENGKSMYQYTSPANIQTEGFMSKCMFTWILKQFNPDDFKANNGIVMTLEFEISESAQIGEKYNIIVESDELTDKNENTYSTYASGSVNVLNYLPGDADDDGSVTPFDAIMVLRYFADWCTFDPNGYAVQPIEAACDVDANGVIEPWDAILILRYCVDGCKYDPDGYRVKLLPAVSKIEHNLSYIEAKAPTCTENGNIAYWYCIDCGKCFSDANGYNEMTDDQVIIKTTGHTYSDAWDYNEDYHWHNTTCEHINQLSDVGEHTYVNHVCSVCNYPESFTVEFIDYNGMIIDSQIVDYGESATKPSDPSRSGYRFIGWNIAFTNITDNLTVIAQYIKQYNVVFVDSNGDVLKTDIVDKGQSVVAPNAPQKTGYDFIGWDKSFDNVINDLTVVAQYSIKTFNVTFKMPDGTDIKYVDYKGVEHLTQTVEYGSFAVAPTPPKYYFNEQDMKAYGFSKWNGSYNNIVNDTIVVADYAAAVNTPVLAIKLNETGKKLKSSLTLSNLSNVALYGINLRIKYKTDMESSTISMVIENVEINSAVDWLWQVTYESGSEVKKPLFSQNYNNKTREYNFAWSNGGSNDSISVLEYLTFIESIELSETIGGLKKYFVIDQCELIISSDGGDELDKVTPIVLYS